MNDLSTLIISGFHRRSPNPPVRGNNVYLIPPPSESFVCECERAGKHMLVTKFDFFPSVFLFLLCLHGMKFGRRMSSTETILLTETFGEAINNTSDIINEKLSIKRLKYCLPDSGEDCCLIPIVIPHLYHNAIRLPSKRKRSKEIHGLVSRSLRCLFLCTCCSFGWRPCSRGGRYYQLPSSSRLVTATQEYFFLSSCDNYCLLCKEVTAKATSSTQNPPNHWESVPAI